MNNRAINFRMWHPQTNRFYYLYLDELIGIGDRVINIPEKSVLQQFTGLTDSNEKEIYEGDVIKMKGDTKPFSGIGKRKLRKAISQVFQ